MIETILGGLVVIGIAGIFRASYLHPQSYPKLNERVSLFTGICAAFAMAYFIGYTKDRDVPWSNPNVAYPLWIFGSCVAIQLVSAIAPYLTSGLGQKEAEGEDKDQ